MSLSRFKLGCFLSFEFLLYAGFLYLDLVGSVDTSEETVIQLSNGLKYLSVILCCSWQWKRKNQQLRYAQLMVLAADFFLLFSENYVIGVLCFLGVQFFYHQYLIQQDKQNAGGTKVREGWLRLLLGGLAFFYAGILLKNVIDSCYQARRGVQRARCFATGLVLLLLCDVHVALYNVPQVSHPILKGWQELSQPFIWLFYLPSQVLVALVAVEGENAPDLKKQT